MGVEGHERWRDNWRVVSPPAGVLVELGRARGELASTRRRVAGLPSGTPVVLVSPGPAAGRRCRSFASRAGIRLERDYLAFPAAARPAYLVENEDAPVRAFMSSVLVAPPGARFAGALELLVAVVRRLGRRRLLSAVAPGRVVVGWRL
jgi:hypothetical protein